MSVPATRLLAAHQPVTVLLAPHLFVAGLPAAAHRAGGLPSGDQTDQVVPWISESSGEMSAMSVNAEPGLARPPS